MKLNYKLALGVAGVAAIVGGGVAVAASDGSRSEESKAVIDSAADKLGVSPAKLTDALKQALKERVDAAVAAGRLTKAQGDALKERIDSDEFPLFGGVRHHGFGHGHFHALDGAADYLGVSESQLRSELADGKTLAQIAQAHGKSADGLVDALAAKAKERLDGAVDKGRLTQAQADEMLEGLRDRIESLVNSPLPARPRFHLRSFEAPSRPA